MAEDRLTGDNLQTPELLAAAINAKFAEYNVLMQKAVSKDEWARMVMDQKDLLGKILVSTEAEVKMKEELEKLHKASKIQGETMAKLMQTFKPTEQHKTFGSVLDDGLSTKEFKDFADGKTSKATFSFETKDIDFTTATYGVGAGAMQPVMPFQIPQGPQMENFDVRLLLPTGSINSSSLEYPTERAAGLTDATAAAAENGPSPESTIDFQMGTAYATRITAFIEISRSALQNASWLNQYVRNRLMQMFIKELNTQSIAGAGSGAGMVAANDLKGLDAFANSFAGTNFATKIPNANYFDVLNCAKGEMNGLYNYVANTYLINPYSGTILTSSKNTIADFVSPATFLQPNNQGYNGAFGMRQVETADMVVGEYMVGAIAPSNMQLLFNGPIEIMATDSHASQFISDVITVKIEGKVMLPVYNANSLMKGVLATDLATITTA